MSDFLVGAVSFPTVVYTVLIALFLVYAALVLSGAADFDALDEGEASPLGNMLEVLGIAGVPFTIFAGVASVFGFLTSYVANRVLPENLLLDIPIFAGAGMAGVGAASFALRPMRRLFVTSSAPMRSESVGKICTIRSLAVTGESGTAEIGDLVVEVRCGRANDLTIGSTAIVYEYDPKQRIYFVGPIDASIADVDAAIGLASGEPKDLRREPWISSSQS